LALKNIHVISVSIDFKDMNLNTDLYNTIPKIKVVVCLVIIFIVCV